MSSSVLFAILVTVTVGCGGRSATPARPTSDPAADPKQLTAAECAAAGGTVVGDIGDGAIHRPDYRCPESDEPPIGTVVADPGGPVAIEGAVCCR